MPGSRFLKIQIITEDGWCDIGEVGLLEDAKLGLNARSEFIYNIDYAIRYADDIGWRAVSVASPVSTVPMEFEQWPPFLLDLFPQGAALKYVVDHYRILDRPENYWKIIQTAVLNPPGNLRVAVDGVKEAPGESGHPGFSKKEVVKKGPDFLEYMIENGAPVAGATGAGGAAPKFLLREDRKGRFHADRVISDSNTKACWLVKFRRGTSKADTDILNAEKLYHDLAKEMGLRTFGSLTWESNCLFVPRFDRLLRGSKIEYLGLESFYSMVGRAEFGSRLRHETYLKGIYQYSTNKQDDLIEYCLRDFLNQMMGNTDNHGRNQSLLKHKDEIALAPVYDFAPMKFDPEGIVRSTSWEDPIENGNIMKLTELLVEEFEVDRSEWDRKLCEFLLKSRKLEQRMRALKVSEAFVAGTKDERVVLIQRMETYCKSLS